jgi:hypothetical protein
MSSLLWFAGTVVSFLIAANAQASTPSSRSASMQVSLKIEELCQIASTADPTNAIKQPTARCQHDAPYRLFRTTPRQLSTQILRSDVHRTTPIDGIWEIEF